eukprot:CAMPEP_0206234314 /NCGR_PEP_ID=MMETSP0047_2-20121206/12527_1 /ASSEMBLY_ACC=CAM_ASM_000192 /TAXON_ID=195065 /ORGANISM="Chroomonas mesostigmatica_cf, Strain CCMP1168" /LENGTH=300 /DNA_ID=CAMNT_0053658397 /DNA_START=1238 /DNA_END=2137 /DNA_ORIENTATION=+
MAFWKKEMNPPVGAGSIDLILDRHASALPPAQLRLVGLEPPPLAPPPELKGVAAGSVADAEDDDVVFADLRAGLGQRRLDASLEGCLACGREQVLRREARYDEGRLHNFPRPHLVGSHVWGPSDRENRRGEEIGGEEAAHPLGLVDEDVDAQGLAGREVRRDRREVKDGVLVDVDGEVHVQGNAHQQAPLLHGADALHPKGVADKLPNDLPRVVLDHFPRCCALLPAHLDVPDLVLARVEHDCIELRKAVGVGGGSDCFCVDVDVSVGGVEGGALARPRSRLRDHRRNVILQEFLALDLP